MYIHVPTKRRSYICQLRLQLSTKYRLRFISKLADILNLLVIYIYSTSFYKPNQEDQSPFMFSRNHIQHRYLKRLYSLAYTTNI